ncbi:hypothetical protein PR048_019762 [Dryococelus australis]|uniref:Ig-like domain-containing protein n=1 Tax=Dryococelus australis TaxID=614101 RepID=A0ABQ9H4N1_9NEOP|nr:hypothetical protein PR048_019762 [Dryococelus australis]
MRTYYVVSLWALVVLVATDESWSNCPAVCKCKWNSGHKTAGCTNASLATVPSNLSSQMQSIDLSHNAFETLPADAFRSVNLVNLHKVFLRYCGIHNIDRLAFAGLEILIELDLSWNYIQVLHPITFRDNIRLRQVYVNHNPLQKLQDGIFNNLVFLHRVDASDCELTHIGERAFIDVPKLHDLKLNNNNLTTIKLAAVQHIHSLVSLVLFGNPWLCNCDLKFFIDWAIYKNLYTPPTMCQDPPLLRGKLWSELTVEDLACRPQISVPTPVVEASEDNVTLCCQSSGSPTPDMHWVFNSRIIANNSKRHLLKESVSSVRWLNLTVIGVGVQDAGDYMCVVKSPGGMEERSVFLKVLEGPERRAGAREGGYSTETLSLIVGLVTGSFILFITASVLTFYFFCRKGFRTNNEPGVTSPVKRAACCESSANGEKFTLTSSPTQKPQMKLETSLITEDGTEMAHVKCSFLNNGPCQCSGVDVAEEKLTHDPVDSLEPDSSIPQEELFVTMAVADCRAYPPDLVPYPKRIALGTPNAFTWNGQRSHSAMSCSRSQAQFVQHPGLAANPTRWTGWGSADRLSSYDNIGPRATVDGSAVPVGPPPGVTHVASQTCQGLGGLPSCQSAGGLSSCQAYSGSPAFQDAAGRQSCQRHGGVPGCQVAGGLSSCQAPAFHEAAGRQSCQMHGGVPSCQAAGTLPSCQSTGLSSCQAHSGFLTCQEVEGRKICQMHGGVPGFQAAGPCPSCQSSAPLQGCHTHDGAPSCPALGRVVSCQAHSGGAWACGPHQEQQLPVS